MPMFDLNKVKITREKKIKSKSYGQRGLLDRISIKSIKSNSFLEKKNAKNPKIDQIDHTF